jgi:iron complex outermembrane recepter protein
MKNLKPTQIALLVSALFTVPALWAQQAAPTDVGRIAVEGAPGGTSTGLITQEDTPKARSSVSKAHLESLNPSSNPYQAIDLLPGVSTFSHDATGLFGGGMRVRGANSDQMGFTINGAPVNDSGSFTVFPQEYTDTENLCEIFVTQGSTDSEAPHVGASGGNVGMVSCSPADKFGVRFSQSLGQLNFRKTFIRLDTGKIAGDTLKAYISYSKSAVDKFKGPGKADRDHIDFGAEFKPNDAWFASTSFLYNNAVNNNFRLLTKAQIAASGDRLDFGSVPPVHATPGAGTQTDVLPADGYYEFAINPFKNYLWTGKVEYKLNKDIGFSAEPYFWYGYGTGGTQLTTLNERGFIGALRDINGDGDSVDTVAVYRSSVTQTFRPGITLKTNLKLGGNNILAGYWYEKARHAQTQPAVRIDNFGNAADRWLEDENLYIKRQTGASYQGRNQLTISTASSLFVQDTINLMQDKLSLQLGLRQSEIKREFNNYANEGLGQGADYAVTKTYSKLLPSIGAKYQLDAQQQVFFNVAENMKAPGNFSYGGLLLGGSLVNGVFTGFRQRDPVVDMETSTNLDIGYRYAGDQWTFSGSLYYINFKNRIATTRDFVNNVSIDLNVGDVITKGLELETGYKLNSNWSMYGSMSFTNSKMLSNFVNPNVAGGLIEPTSGKQLPDTPEMLAGLRVAYNNGPFYANVDAKYTDRVFSTLVNDEQIDAYTVVNATLGYRFSDTSFMKKPSIQFNVANLFDQSYLRINSSSGSQFSIRALGVQPPNQFVPQYYVGAPRFASVTFRANF